MSKISPRAHIIRPAEPTVCRCPRKAKPIVAAAEAAVLTHGRYPEREIACGAARTPAAPARHVGVFGNAPFPERAGQVVAVNPWIFRDFVGVANQPSVGTQALDRRLAAERKFERNRGYGGHPPEQREPVPLSPPRHTPPTPPRLRPPPRQ